MENINTENINTELYPAFEENNVPVIFSVDNAFIPYMGAALKSVIENSKASNNYDIIILEEEITPYNKQLINALCKDYSNFSIRFYNMKSFVDKFEKDTFFTTAQFSISTYYRLFITEILKNYSKAVYLDSDIAVLDDIAELYKLDLGDNFIAATPCVQTVYNAKLKRTVPEWNIPYDQYFSEQLNINDPDSYFQAGVLVFNISEMKKTDIIPKFIEKLKEIKTPSLVDQDILNAVCNGKVTFFGPEWNHMYHLQDPSILKGVLSDDSYDKFELSRNNPRVIHYTSKAKPWFHPHMILAHHFWEYAKQTPFYETILAAMMIKQIDKNNVKIVNTINKLIDQNNQKVLNTIKKHIDENNTEILDTLNIQIEENNAEVLNTINKQIDQNNIKVVNTINKKIEENNQKIDNTICAGK